MSYGQVLRAARIKAGMSQEELAARLHINQSDVSKYESGAKEPRISIFRDWTFVTQAQEVMVGFLCGVDGVAMMTMLQQMSTVIAGFIGGWFI